LQEHNLLPSSVAVGQAASKTKLHRRESARAEAVGVAPVRVVSIRNQRRELRVWIRVSGEVFLQGQDITVVVAAGSVPLVVMLPQVLAVLAALVWLLQ
jgi:hypothetical protein